MKKAGKKQIFIAAAVLMLIASVFFIGGCGKQGGTTPSENQTQPNTANQSNTPQANNTSPQQNNQEQCNFTIGTADDINGLFKWHNLAFEGATEGNSATFTYSTIIDVKERNGLVTGKFVITQKNNPSRIEDINSSITGMPGKKAYISLDKSISKYPNRVIASSELSNFLGILGITSESAVTATSADIPDPNRVKTCANADDGTTVFILKSSGCNPGITQEGNCITIDAGSGGYVVEAVERAIMDMIELGMEQSIIK